jgi:hydroxymethylglutaryl-CoA reductase
MNVSELIQVMGKTGEYVIGELRFPIAVIDGRTVYGKTQYQIVPVGGNGKAWVDKGSVIL